MEVRELKPGIKNITINLIVLDIGKFLIFIQCSDVIDVQHSDFCCMSYVLLSDRFGSADLNAVPDEYCWCVDNRLILRSLGS